MSEFLLLASALAAVFLLLVVFLFSRRSVATRRGSSVLLVGAADAGKTSIFSKLAYDNPLPSHTSLQTNVSTFLLEGEKRIQIVDTPGHPRIRDQFRDHLEDARVVVFVVDSSTVSRNGAEVAEHLHLIMHAISNLPASHKLPTLLVLAHKADLLKTTSTTNEASSGTHALNRVRTVLERELEKRKTVQANGLGVEKLGEDAEKSDVMGGLECSGPTFTFDHWDGGECLLIATSSKTEGGLDSLSDALVASQ
ncbi:P-loop containing nucleoside triphosphate hydrolase protein, partial [Cylindrobasidium torrendii FP15055 ss-10]